MSRSYKQPVIKDSPRNFKKSAIYWRTIRRVINYTIRKFKSIEEEMILPREKSICNDYSNYTSDCRFNDNCYCIKNYGRKKCKYK